MLGRALRSRAGLLRQLVVPAVAKLPVQRLFKARHLRAMTTTTSTSDAAENFKGSEGQLTNLLTDAQKRASSRIKLLLERLRAVLKDMNLSKEDSELLKNAISSLEEMFLLVVVGEFNSGKSQFVNALLGAPHCKVGVLPTTEHIHILRHGSKVEHIIESENVHTLRLPVEMLRETHVVDTPGTNAILRSHQEITEHFVPRSDLVMFVTSVDRPFSESERQFLQRVTDWKKKVTIVLNKVDMVHDQTDIHRIIDFVRSNAKQVLHQEPHVFPVSARMALQAKSASPPNYDQLEHSGFAALERHIVDSLEGGNRIRLKLENPLGLGETLINKYQQMMSDRSRTVEFDMENLKEIEANLAEFQKSMTSDFELQRAQIDVIFLRLLDNIDQFLTEQVTLSRLPQLLNSEQLKKDFDKQVNSRVVEDIQECVTTLMDWIVDKSNKQAQQIVKAVSQRDVGNLATATTAELARAGLDFHATRQALIMGLQKSVTDVLSTRDKEKESSELVSDLRRAVLQTAALEVGALGMGGVFTAAMFDWTGLAGAGALAVAGLYVVPFRRAQLKKKMRQQINELRANMQETLRRHFTSNLNHSVRSMQQAINPYSRFVRTEHEKLATVEENLQGLRKEIADARHQVYDST